MAVPANLKLYLDQWLSIAGNGNLEYQCAAVADRVMFICTLCEGQYTVPSGGLDASTVDYGVQEFVRLHRHDGKWGDVVSPVTQTSTVAPLPLTPIVAPLTLDFKPVKVLKTVTGRKFR